MGNFPFTIYASHYIDSVMPFDEETDRKRRNVRMRRKRGSTNEKDQTCGNPGFGCN